MHLGAIAAVRLYWQEIGRPSELDSPAKMLKDFKQRMLDSGGPEDLDTSGMHLYSGVIIFIGVAILLYLLGLSLESEAGFAEAQQLLSSPLAKFVVWGIVSGLLYHLVAGTKHLVMDWGFGETLAGAAIGSRITLVLSTLLIVIAGVWIW
jgi:succinate dehydrogenase / fumarate reductase cytochrome b subunit